MAKRIISFVDGAELPFLVDPYPEIPGDFDWDAGDPPEPDHAAMLAKMRRAIPRDAVYLGVIGENLNGQPGSCWRVEDHFYPCLSGTGSSSGHSCASPGMTTRVATTGPTMPSEPDSATPRRRVSRWWRLRSSTGRSI